MIEDCWREQFDFLQVNPLVWAHDADSLMRSFDIISQQSERDLHERIKRAEEHLAGKTKNELASYEHQLYPPEIGHHAMMLGALAIEVLLKGIALSEPSILKAVQSKDKKIIGRLWTHHLKDIAEMGGVPLSIWEIALCERLEFFLLWAGRYSTPKNHQKMIPFELPDGGVAIPNMYSSADFGSIRRLAIRLRANFRE
ncbi:MAG: hypothetical protein ABL911_05205 [Gallionella sp.]|nr:hypothetical protein [Gallionella sp.]